ncbi:MAG: PAS domain-containing sensor histidine kinase [Candidatus Peribacter sp.]|nr:PAS domain-containing sensor histidine kinase [Candidatus Peribacter sp.]
MSKITHSPPDGIALKLKVLAKEKEVVRRKLVVTAREKEVVRCKLVMTAKKLRLKARQLAATAREKEAVRRKLVVTAREKEVVRRKLLVTANELRMSRKTLEKKVLERTKDLEKVRAKDEAILASIGEGLVATDKNGRVLFVNKACERLLGWKEGETQGKLLLKVIPMSDSTGKTIPESERLITKTLKDRSTTTTTTTMYYKRKDGTSFPVAITVAPIFIGKELIGAVKVFRDITKEKEIEKARSEFMSIASHQLRTPLTAIRWVLSSLKRENLTEDQAKLVKTAHETSMNMASTIRRMLMISHLEEDGMEPELEQVILQKELEKISRLHDAHRQRNGLELALECPQDLMVRTDKQLLIEILDNLLSNALKYTPRGGKVRMSVTKEKESIRIDVADTGYGIPQEEQKRIPEKFFRASNVASPVEAGTGIGLYMVYNIVRLIGGTISFISQENKGTTFTLLFPS